MASLYAGNEHDRAVLRTMFDGDVTSDLLDLLKAGGLPVEVDDPRYLDFLREVTRQAEIRIDAQRVGAWVVSNEVEQRWLTAALSALAEAWKRNRIDHRYEFEQELEHDLTVWIEYFGGVPVVLVDSSTASIDLSEYTEALVGRCQHCGAQTNGINLDENDDPWTATDWNRFEHRQEAGGGWCDTCWGNRCDNCCEKPKELHDDELCAECRKDYEEENSHVTEVTTDR